jgi:hypothetical protein
LCDFSLASFMSLYLFVEVFLAFFIALVESNKQKFITSTLGDCFAELITLLQDSRSLILSPLVESNRKSIHFRFQVIESKVDRSEWSHRDGCSF